MTKYNLLRTTTLGYLQAATVSPHIRRTQKVSMDMLDGLINKQSIRIQVKPLLKL